jgi:transcriptional repressor NrdR
MVIKKDGRREEFNQGKLRQKLRVALTKRPVSEEQIDKVIARVEAELLALNLREVPSDAVGEAVLRQLRDLDQVAYIRFASVYRQFADLEELRKAVDTLS